MKIVSTFLLWSGGLCWKHENLFFPLNLLEYIMSTFVCYYLTAATIASSRIIFCLIDYKMKIMRQLDGKSDKVTIPASAPSPDGTRWTFDISRPSGGWARLESLRFFVTVWDAVTVCILRVSNNRSAHLVRPGGHITHDVTLSLSMSHNIHLNNYSRLRLYREHRFMYLLRNDL